LIHSLIVHEGNIQDRDGTKLVLFKVKGKMPRLVKIFADAGYAGKLIQYVLLWFGWILEIVKRTDKGFKILPFRWIVERTFGWFNNYRGLSKDYEYSTKSSESMIYLAMLHLMLRRLAK
jgi:putative transposase